MNAGTKSVVQGSMVASTVEKVMGKAMVAMATKIRIGGTRGTTVPRTSFSTKSFSTRTNVWMAGA